MFGCYAQKVLCTMHHSDLRGTQIGHALFVNGGAFERERSLILYPFATLTKLPVLGL